MQPVPDVEGLIPFDTETTGILNIETVAGIGDAVADKAIVWRIPDVNPAPALAKFKLGSSRNPVIADGVALGMKKVDAKEDIPELIAFNEIAIRSDEDAGVFIGEHAPGMLNSEVLQDTGIRNNGNNASLSIATDDRILNSDQCQAFIDQEAAGVGTRWNSKRISGTRSGDGGLQII